MDDRDGYIKGYEEGLKEAWGEAMRLIARGYTTREIQIILKGKMATVHQIIDAKRHDMPGPDAGKDDSLYLRSFGMSSSPAPAITPTPAPPPEPEPPRLSNPAPKELEKGSYLINELKPEKAFALFKELLEGGNDGLAIVRTYPGNVRKRYGLDDVQMVWLTKTESFENAVLPSGLGVDASDFHDKAREEYISPTDLTKLTTTVSGFMRASGGGAILLEGLDYLITQNGFETVMRFVQFMNDAVLRHDSYLILPFDPATRDPKEFQRLRKEIEHEV